MKPSNERWNDPLKLTIKQLKTLSPGTVRIKAVINILKYPFSRSIDTFDFEIFTAKNEYVIAWIDLPKRERGIYSVAIRDKDMKHLNEQAALKLTFKMDGKLQYYSNIILIK